MAKKGINYSAKSVISKAILSSSAFFILNKTLIVDGTKLQASHSWARIIMNEFIKKRVVF